MLQISDSDSTERKIDGIENDTAVVLQGVDGEKLIYCIYEENILPERYDEDLIRGQQFVLKKSL